MKTGFFLKRDELQLQYPLRTVDFGFMQNELCEDYSSIEQAETSDLYGFLHGYCDVFAPILSRMIPGSKVEYLHVGNSLVHAYVVKDGTYIDVRGMNTDWNDFIREFEEELPTTDRSRLDIRPRLKPSLNGGSPYDPALKSVVSDILFCLSGYYGLNVQLRAAS